MIITLYYRQPGSYLLNQNQNQNGDVNQNVNIQNGDDNLPGGIQVSNDDEVNQPQVEENNNGQMDQH